MHAPALSVGKDKLDTRWEVGVWLGIRAESGESLIGTSDGVVKARISEESQRTEADGARKSLTSSEACRGSRIREPEEGVK